MLGLSDSQLAKMRAQVNELLPGTCVIYAPANVVDSGGGATHSYTPVTGGTVGCRIDPLGNRTTQLEVYAQRETTKVLQQLTVPYNAPLLSNYQVVSDGNTWEVVQIDVVHSWNVSKRAIIAKVE